MSKQFLRKSVLAALAVLSASYATANDGNLVQLGLTTGTNAIAIGANSMATSTDGLAKGAGAVATGGGVR